MSEEYKNYTFSAEVTRRDDLLHLYKSLWKARGRRSKVAGVVYLVLSAIFFLLSYFMRYIVFEIVSILCLILGVALIFISMERYVKLDVANEALISALLPINRLVASLKFGGRAAYIPRNSDVFVFLDEEGKGITEEGLREIEAAGMFEEKAVVLPSLGVFLTRLYEREFAGSFQGVALDYLIQWLPRVIVDGLKIAEKADILREEDKIRVKVVDFAFYRVCEEASINLVCKKVGCPFCASIANALAINTQRIVFYRGCEYSQDTRGLAISYELGPSVKQTSKAMD